LRSVNRRGGLNESGVGKNDDIGGGVVVRGKDRECMRWMKSGIVRLGVWEVRGGERVSEWLGGGRRI
jgi:hypothetical protein